MDDKKKSLAKKVIPGMMPVKEYLDIEEAKSYLNVSVNTLKETAIKCGLGFYKFGDKKLYLSVSEINKAIKSNPVIRCTMPKDI